MIFDVYYAFTNKAGIQCPGVKPHPTEWSEIIKLASQPWVADVCKQILEQPENKAELKKKLPAVCYTATCSPTRAAANAIPSSPPYS